MNKDSKYHQFHASKTYPGRYRPRNAGEGNEKRCSADGADEGREDEDAREDQVGDLPACDEGGFARWEVR